MFRNRLYYHLKPLLPPSARMALRRWFALRKRDSVLDQWPILPGSEKPPTNWPGWPDGKQFAFVLTHDVEGPEGLAKVRKLAELEMQLGFRSCFNFIPEGDYTVPSTLLTWLVENGFEVGVHDLHHDGKLFSSREVFQKGVPRINRHLKEWGAVGFRSGFMLSELDWLHGLDIQYDCSTFDTDPFEPQPDGVSTIFPFWVPRNEKLKAETLKSEMAPNAGLGSQKSEARSQKPDPTSVVRPPSSAPKFQHFSISASQHLPAPESECQHFSFSAFQRFGYIELPYTLPQDSTLFLLFRERHPDIWFQKLDWIAKHGGMALLNVHPDYLRFEGEPASVRTYPVEHYARLLRYALERHETTFWKPLPRDVARYARSLTPVPRPHRPKRVCMLTHSFYESDGRVTRYAEALAGRGDEVDVFSLRRSPDTAPRECLAGVNVHRIQGRFGKREKSQFAFLFRLVRFLLVSSLWITREHVRKPYDLIHIHNVPDFLVFAAWYPKLTGARIILDVHDIVPEFYASKFGARENSWLVKTLKWIERASARFAHRVIISNHLWLDKYAARTGSNGKCSVFINNVDGQIFQPRPRTRKNDRRIVLFPGGLQWHQGLDIAIRAFQKVNSGIPHAEFHIYGDGNMKDSLVALAYELGLDGKVRFFDPVPVRQVAEIMANADLGVVPKRADSFGNEAYSTKIMEFMSLGVPVVASNTKIDRYYFNDSDVRFFESGNSDALAEAVVDVFRNQTLRDRLVTNGLDYATRNSWQARKADYLNLVDDLCVRRTKD